MTTSTTIRSSSAGLDVTSRVPGDPWRSAARALRQAWRGWRQRQAIRALRRRALAIAATHPAFAADLAAATGCTLAELIESGDR